MRIFVLPVVAATLCAPLWAQQTKQLTLAEAQRLAILNNPQIAAARLNAAAAHQVPAQLRANFSPVLAGNVTGVGADSGSRLAAGALNNGVVYDRLGTGLSISQLLVDFGRTNNLIDSAKFRAQAQDQVAETRRADILLAVSRAYFSLLRAEAVGKVAEQTVAARRLVADQVTALAASKLKSELDVSFANVNLADAQLLLVQAQTDVRSAEAELATAIGLPDQTGLMLREEPMPAPLPDRVDALVREAIDNRPELKDLRLQQSAAGRFAKAERALHFPSVGVFGAAGVVPAGEAAIPGRYGAVGLNLTIPVFNGGAVKARQTEAELRAQAATENVNDLANRVTRDVRVAYLNAAAAYDRVGLTAQLLKHAQLSLDLAQSRYDQGLSSIADLIRAQLSLTSAQIAAASARYDYRTQRVAVDYQIGALR
jgi:outer membrane protein